MPPNPGEPLFVWRQKHRAGTGHGGSQRDKLPAWKQRTEGTNGFSSNSKMGLLLLRDLLPAELAAQPALGRALEPGIEGRGETPHEPTTEAAASLGCEGAFAYLPQHRDARGPAKKVGCGCVCVRGAPSNTPETKPPGIRARVRLAKGLQLCVVGDEEGGRAGRGLRC